MLPRTLERAKLGARSDRHPNPGEGTTDRPLECEGKAILDVVAPGAGRDCDRNTAKVDRVGQISSATAERDQRRVQPQELAADVGGRSIRKPADRHIEAAIGDGGELLAVTNGELLHRELRMRAGEPVEHEHRGVVPGDMRHTKLGSACVRELPDRVKCLEDISGGWKQTLPGRGKPDATRTANEQRRANLALELANRPREPGLGKEEPVRGA